MFVPTQQEAGSVESSAVYRYLFATLRSRHPRAAYSLFDADDLVQEVLLRAAQSSTPISGDLTAAMRRWLRMALTHVVIDSIRRRLAARRLVERVGELPAPDCLTALDCLLAAEEIGRLRSAVRCLAENDRVVLEAMLAGGCESGLAAQIGVSAIATRKRCCRAIARLKQAVLADPNGG